MHIYRQNDGTSGNLRWFVVQELWVDELELAYAIGNIIDLWDLVGIEDPQEPLHELHGAWEVEVEAHLDDDL